jgi:hypothetical protein
LWKTILVIAKDLVWSAAVECRQRSAVPADHHHVFTPLPPNRPETLFALEAFDATLSNRQMTSRLDKILLIITST